MQSLKSFSEEEKLPSLKQRLVEFEKTLSHTDKPEQMKEKLSPYGRVFLINPSPRVISKIKSSMINEYAEEEMKDLLVGDDSYQDLWVQNDRADIMVFNPLITRSKGYLERFYEEVEREGLSYLTLHYTHDKKPKLKISENFVTMYGKLPSYTKQKLFKFKSEHEHLPSGQEYPLDLIEYQSWMPFYIYSSYWKHIKNRHYFTLFINCNP